MADYFLSKLLSGHATQESSRSAALLASSGHSVADITPCDSSWAVRASGGSGGGYAAPASAGVGGIATSELEEQIRTLHVEPYTLLTAEERKAQANRNKATPGKKRQAAYPGDSETDIADEALNPLAEWPWEQQLPLRKTDSYSLCGRIVRNTLQWCNRNFTDALMQATLKSHQEAQVRIYKRFTSFVEDGKFDGALLCAHQAVSEALEEMEAVVESAQLFASHHPDSAMIAHIAKRRKAQESELVIYLAYLSHRVNAAQKTPDTAAQQATVAFIDFLDGWMNKIDVAQIRPESLQQASTSAAASTMALRLSSQGAGLFGVGGGVTSNKTPRIATTPSANGAGGSSGRTGSGSNISEGKGSTPRAARPFKNVSKICVIQQNIPCSKHVIGDTLGLAVAPPCKICRKGAHFYGECPQAWGNIGTPLPGHRCDGSRIAGEWNKNEPIQQVMKAWLKFLSDTTNFNGSIPAPAGVAGAPTLTEFKARVASAPVKA